MRYNALEMVKSAQDHLRAASQEDCQRYHLRLCYKQLLTSLAMLRLEENGAADEIQMALQHLKDYINRPHNEYARGWLVSHMNKALACMCARYGDYLEGQSRVSN